MNDYLFHRRLRKGTRTKATISLTAMKVLVNSRSVVPKLLRSVIAWVTLVV
jgi:hypothetical protein